MGFIDLAAWGSVEPSKASQKCVPTERCLVCVFGHKCTGNVCAGGGVHVHSSDPRYPVVFIHIYMCSIGG